MAFRPELTGSQEVTGSIPVSSTNEINDLEVETNSANSPVLILVPSWLH